LYNEINQSEIFIKGGKMKRAKRNDIQLGFFILMIVVLACGRNNSGTPDQPSDEAPADESPEIVESEEEGESEVSVQSQEDCTDSMAFVSDVSIPDGYIINANESFIKTWRIQNTGDCFWIDYSLQFESGEPMGTMEQVIPDTPAGEELDISVEMTSPGGVGNFTGYWSVIDHLGNSLGRLSCVITVPSQEDANEGDSEEPEGGEDISVPAAPTNFRDGIGDTETKTMPVNWDDNSDNEDGFKIRRVGMAWLKNPTGPNETSFTIHTPCGEAHEYHVVAFNAAGNSEPSNAIFIEGPPCD